jgi:hypothetical protein
VERCRAFLAQELKWIQLRAKPPLPSSIQSVVILEFTFHVVLSFFLVQFIILNKITVGTPPPPVFFNKQEHIDVLSEQMHEAKQARVKGKEEM